MPDDKRSTTPPLVSSSDADLPKKTHSPLYDESMRAADEQRAHERVDSAVASGEILGPVDKSAPPPPLVSSGDKGDTYRANYKSRNDLTRPAGASTGADWTRGSERVPYKKVAEAGDRPCGACEDRRKLNDQREARTKLGRGKPAIVEVE